MEQPPQPQPYQPQPYNEVAEQVGLNTQINQATLSAKQAEQFQYQREEAEQTLAEAQLDCEQTLTKIYHLLRQDVYKWDEKKQDMDWFEIEDKKKRVLTEEGVEKMMQVMQSYINKETLLSNFDEKTIARRMLEFSLALSAVIFMKYEIYFRTPTLNECKDILQNRIDEKIKRRKINLELMSRKVDEVIIKEEVIKEVEPRIEYEIQKIKQEQTKLNLREFEMMFTQLRALVEATHNRAWKGEERGSLRRHFNISEIIGGKPQQSEKKKWGFF